MLSGAHCSPFLSCRYKGFRGQWQLKIRQSLEDGLSYLDVSTGLLMTWQLYFPRTRRQRHRGAKREAVLVHSL